MSKYSFLPFFSALILLFATFVSADFTVIGPAAGSTYTGGSTVVVQWKDDGESPALDTFDTLQVLICTGPNSGIDCDNITPLATLTTAADIDAGKTSVVIPPTVGSNGLWFFQVYALKADKSSLWRYSARFTLSGMTGTARKATSGSDTTRPAGGSVAGSTVTSGAEYSASFTVPYPLQSGPTKFAPMQQQPGTKVTVSVASRRFPTSAVTYYSSVRKSPDAVSTITPGWSYTTGVATNYATPAPNPSINSYYPASAKLASLRASASAARRLRRRWVD
ncbi:cell wall synthesis KRE9KNH1 [Nadsonia fulvescens var. elongata DSM 6958]|uniref:Cell wall synthesis KRE9KNH1 n=1 Tax=Nadsonia fulvescens var. elongata DSM 6958 TaxID=857566 RepID=A0A1E3PSS3_9ASCO|nr:cell wall synthesis KRE9KNH1 [Nadsonia fulvescens var. elongata DSM 6958]